MSLDLGTLVGYLELDDSPFSGVLEKAGDKLKEFGGKGAALAATAGVAVAGAFAGSLLANMDIEKSNDKLAASLGLTEGESARVGKVAGSLYADAYGDSMEDVDTAVAAVMTSIKGMATASSQELQGVTADAMNFAAAFDVDVERAVSSVGIVLKSGLAKDATEAFDLLTAASQRVPTALREDVLDASDEYSQFFHALGIGGQQAFGMLVKGAEKGMYGIDKVGDAVKEFTIRATDGSKSTALALESLGLNFHTVENDLLAGGDKANKAFHKVITGLLQIHDPARRAQTALSLFGTPLEDLSVNDIPKFLKSLQNGTGAMKGFRGSTKQMGDTLNDNASTAMVTMKRRAQQAFLGLANWALPAVDSVTVSLASNLGPALHQVADVLEHALGPAISHVTSFLGDHQVILYVVAGVIMATYLPALIAAGLATLRSGGQQVAGWLMGRLGALGTLAVYAIVAVAIVGWWVLMGVQALAQAARMAAAWFVALGPIGWVTAAIIAIALLIWKNWDKVKKWTGAAWSWVTDKVVGAWHWIKDKTVSIGGAVVDWVKSLPGKLVSFFLNWTLAGLVISHWEQLKSGSIRVATNLISWVKGLPGRIVSAVGDLGSLLLDEGGDLIRGLWEGIKSMGSWLKDKLIGFVKDTIPGPIRKALGINSPSRVARDLARWVPVGIAMGIDDGIGEVAAASDRMAVATIPSLPGARRGFDDDPRRPGAPGAGGTGAGNTYNVYETLNAQDTAKEIARIESNSGGL